MTKDPSPSSTSELGPFVGIRHTPRGWYVQAVWLKDGKKSKGKDIYLGDSKDEAQDAFRIFVGEQAFRGS